MSSLGSQQSKIPQAIMPARSRVDRRKQGKRSTKARRDIAGGKRADGHRRKARVRRPDPRKLRIRATGETLTCVAGLVPFGGFLRHIGLEAELRDRFNRLKGDPRAVYTMSSQIRLLIDMFAAGEERIFGLENLAADPIFVALAGGVVPSLDTCYRDLCRFDEQSLMDAEDMMAAHGLVLLQQKELTVVHLDLDTTVEVLFGMQQGALPGPNPRYHGRPSYHPLIARVEETDTIVAAKLRPGDTGLGKDDVPWIEHTIDRVRKAIGPDAILYVRIDGAADAAPILAAITRRNTFFIVKARLTQNLLGAIHGVPESEWTTTDWDADGQPCEQVAEVHFARDDWSEHRYRVIAKRSIDRPSGKQVFLWDNLDYTVQAYITNELVEAPEGIARRYNPRAGIEPLIGDLKNGWGIGKVPSQVFEANHAALLLKLLAHNLMRRFVDAKCPELLQWRTPWIRRVLINLPGRLIRSGRRWILEVPARSMLGRMLN